MPPKRKEEGEGLFIDKLKAGIGDAAFFRATVTKDPLKKRARYSVTYYDGCPTVESSKPVYFDNKRRATLVCVPDHQLKGKSAIERAEVLTSLFLDKVKRSVLMRKKKLHTITTSHFISALTHMPFCLQSEQRSCKRGEWKSKWNCW